VELLLPVVRAPTFPCLLAEYVFIPEQEDPARAGLTRLLEGWHCL